MFRKSTDFNLTKKACYYSYLSMSSVFSLPPILFLTFREMYGIVHSSRNSRFDQFLHSALRGSDLYLFYKIFQC